MKADVFLMELENNGFTKKNEARYFLNRGDFAK
jgi:hypothetical protein